MQKLVARGVACVVTLVALAGCGESSNGTDDDASGNGGSNGGRSSTPSAAGLTLDLSPPDPSEVPGSEGRSCPAGGTGARTYRLGMPKPLGTISSGTDGVAVSCSVTEEGAAAATMSGPDTNDMQALDFTVISYIDDARRPTAAKIKFFTADTSELEVLEGFPDCTLDPITVLKAGAILADVTCPLLGSVADSSVACRAEGTFAFEYCSTE